MKLGIVTFHSAINYGAVLQTYALQEECKNYTEDCYIINYRPRYIEKNYSFFPVRYNINGEKIVGLSQFKKLLNNIYNANTFFEKKRKFMTFIENNMNLTPIIKDGKDINNLDFQYIICGSDQIWNPEIAEGLDEIYFGNTGSDNKHIRISYAASIGKKEIKNEYISEFSDLLNGLDYISVREKSSVNQLKLICDKNIQCVLDPTLLVDKKIWYPFVNKTITSSKYLLIYRMENNPAIDVLANQISGMLNLSIIEIGPKNLKYFVNHRLISNAGVEDFLSYFYNASFILTNSFHGTAFSIIFNKNFYSILHSNLGVRIKDLLEELQLSDRIISPTEVNLDYESLFSIDWNKTNLILEKMKENSINFIQQSINVRT